MEIDKCMVGKTSKLDITPEESKSDLNDFSAMLERKNIIQKNEQVDLNIKD